MVGSRFLLVLNCFRKYSMNTGITYNFRSSFSGTLIYYVHVKSKHNFHNSSDFTPISPVKSRVMNIHSENRVSLHGEVNGASQQ